MIVRFLSRWARGVVPQGENPPIFTRAHPLGVIVAPSVREKISRRFR